MTDKTLRDAVQSPEGDYEILNDLLACYEAWGGRPGPDADCAKYLGGDAADGDR